MVGYQAGYATHNNLTGLTYPGLLAPISGPVAPVSNPQMVSGSALAANLLWTPLTFGQRQAASAHALAVYRLAASDFEYSLFTERYSAIRSCLEAIYLQASLSVQASNINKTRTGLLQAKVLADQGVRPGLDTAQFKSLLAQAIMDYLDTRRAYTVSVLQLCRTAGLDADPAMIDLPDTVLLQKMPGLPDTTGSLQDHPKFRLQEEQVAEQVSALHELQKAWLPKLEFWGTAYARGSGVYPDGSIHPGSGFQLQRSNYGAGAQITFPILQSARINIQKKQLGSRVSEEKSRLERISYELAMEVRATMTEFKERSLMAEQAPLRTEAASLTYDGLLLSYQNGLSDFNSLVRGQQDLLQAQLQEAAARLATWKSLLDVSVARGNLSKFTDQLTK
jgi:outer membrane protein TolC